MGLPGGIALPIVVALACFAAGAVAGGRLIKAGEAGRRAGFASDASLIGIAALVVALTHPGPSGYARYLVIGILAFAMGIQNALMRRWGIRDAAARHVSMPGIRPAVRQAPGAFGNWPTAERPWFTAGYPACTRPVS